VALPPYELNTVGLCVQAAFQAHPHLNLINNNYISNYSPARF
jgi:hypothetical protein